MMPHVCTQISSAGFWLGLWDGITAPATLILSLFLDVRFYDVCGKSWWYNATFLLGIYGVALIGAFHPTAFAAYFVMSLIAFVIWFLFANIFYIVAFVGVCGIGSLLYTHRTQKPHASREPFRQAGGSEVIPPR